MNSEQDDEDQNKRHENFNPWNSNHIKNNEERENNGMRMWGIFIIGLIGATVTTYAVGQARRTLEWFYTQGKRTTQSQYSWKQGQTNGSQQTKQKSWNEYVKQKFQEEHEEEMERVERIRRMQGVFNRERNKYRRSYEQWHENPSDAYQQQNFQRNDWYWNTEKSYQDRKANEWKAGTRASGNYILARHYEVLGLDTSRAESYSEAEIKAAFRTKAKEFHPDQNPTNKEAAEKKFKEVVISYEALKSEQKKK